jgi:hypothetical protein
VVSDKADGDAGAADGTVCASVGTGRVLQQYSIDRGIGYSTHHVCFHRDRIASDPRHRMRRVLERRARGLHLLPVEALEQHVLLPQRQQRTTLPYDCVRECVRACMRAMRHSVRCVVVPQHEAVLCGTEGWSGTCGSRKRSTGRVTKIERVLWLAVTVGAFAT